MSEKLARLRRDCVIKRKPAPLRLIGYEVLRCDTTIDGKRTVYPGVIVWTTRRGALDTKAIRKWCDAADAWLAGGE